MCAMQHVACGMRYAPPLAFEKADKAREASVQHPNVVPLEAVFKSDERVCLLLEYLEGGQVSLPLHNHNDSHHHTNNTLYAIMCMCVYIYIYMGDVLSPPAF